MTYTIAAHCPRTGQLGIGIATFSLAVGGYCPLIKSHVGAVSSQAYANPRLRRTAMRLLELGYSPDGILAELRVADPHFEYRQIGIVDKDGRGRGAHRGAHETVDGTRGRGGLRRLRQPPRRRARPGGDGRRVRAHRRQ